MLVIVDSSGIRVLEADDLKRLSVRVEDGLPANSVDELLTGDGIGRRDTDNAQQIWLDVQELKVRAGARASLPDWPEHFDGMIEYAASKGWCDATKTAVAAHIE